MALTSALFTGLSGLDVNQTRLNVVGNNIANVNTVAFKSSRALFKPQFYVTDSPGSPPSAEFGGENPAQRGLGAVVASVEKDFAPGAIEPTGKPTDMAIDGDGFFIVQGTHQRYTRDGSFNLNSANELVTSGGDFVQGFGVDASFSVIPGSLQNVNIPLGSLTVARATEDATLEGNLNASGAIASGASILLSQPLTLVGGAAKPQDSSLLTNVAASDANTSPIFSTGDVISLAGKKGGRNLTAQTFTVKADSTVADLRQFFQDAMGIDTSVPDDGNPATPVPGTALKDVAADPNSVQLVLTGNTGAENALSLSGSAFVKTTGSGSLFTFSDGTDANGITSSPAGESVHTSFVAYDSLGTPLTVDITAVLESRSDAGNSWRFYATSPDDTDHNLVLGNGTLVFDSEGKLKSSTGTTVRIDRANTGAMSPLSVKLDFGTMTSLTSTNSELRMSSQDGTPIGTLSSFSVGADGTITGSFTNGLTRTLGQIAIATFKNSQGLIDKGSNMYEAAASSGVAVISTPLTAGAGSVRAGSLELSNVDLSKEFINLIIASTGFSASSRVISTSDQLLTELLNSQR